MAKARRPPKLPWQQLTILAICRLADPIALSSVFPYLPEMIESFGVPQDEVSKWAGITSALFSLSQAFTGILWGRASDRFGRKPVILFGMTAMVSTTVLWGFSRSLAWAVISRCLSGASNGNVGLMRTAVAELVPEKELQPRAYSIMPLMWSIGSIIGPSFGGALADPAHKYPKVFGRSRFFMEFPFALPNLVAAGFFLVSMVVGWLYLHETLETRKHKPDYGRKLGHILLRPCLRRKRRPIHEEEESASLLKNTPQSATFPPDEVHQTGKDKRDRAPMKPPTYREIFKYQTNMNLVVYTLLALHSIAYDQLLPVFMHYPPRSSLPAAKEHLPFQFKGGFGIDSDRIGLIFMAYGVVGMLIQFFAFPPLARHWGVLNCLKIVTIMYPIAYVFTPFTALLPTQHSQQIGIFIVMVFKCWATIFAFPCTTILLTNSATSLRILGTLNGLAVSISGLGRAAGPAITGWAFTVGANSGWSILPWWILAAIGIIAAVPVWWLVEMEGFGDADDSADSSDSEVEPDFDSPDDPLPANTNTRQPPQEDMSSPSVTANGNGGLHPLRRENTNASATESDSLLTPLGLTHTNSSGSRRAAQPRRIVAGPLGMGEGVGPGGGRRLSNALGTSNGGFGSGEGSYS